MKRIRSIFIALLIIIASNLPIEASNNLEQIITANRLFCAELYRQIQTDDGNIFFSPYSISTALLMTLAGARGNTEIQMTQALKFDRISTDIHREMANLRNMLLEGAQKWKYELSISNAIWEQKDYKVLKDFKNILKNFYHSDIVTVNFRTESEAVRKRINQYVEEQTKQKIKELLKPGDINPLTRLVITNAIYFKGLWHNQFPVKQTEPGDFILLNGEKKSVPMMYQTNRFNYFDNQDFQMLDMPYIGKSLSMIIILPKKIDGLLTVEKQLSAQNLAIWISFLRNRQVNVYLPRFQISSQFNLAKTLASMGMPDAFQLPPADFSGISGKKDLFISSVVHQAYIDVTEQGSEAAAATGVVMSRSVSIPEPPVVFRADHPFIFMIMDHTSGLILFFGKMVNV